jgi:hypothetical protein
MGERDDNQSGSCEPWMRRRASYRDSGVCWASGVCSRVAQGRERLAPHWCKWTVNHKGHEGHKDELPETEGNEANEGTPRAKRTAVIRLEILRARPRRAGLSAFVTFVTFYSRIKTLEILRA